MRIALFGTSADPPTGDQGHRGLVSWLVDRWLAELDGIPDEVWILPVYRHPFDKQMSAFEDRMAMARLNFGDLPRVRVLGLERERVEEGEAPGSLALVRHLRRRHPDHRFAWVMGWDTHQDLMAGRWSGGLAFAEEVARVVVRREGEGGDDDAYVVPGLGNVSSSEARRQARSGRYDLVGPRVAIYAALRKLYDEAD